MPDKDDDTLLRLTELERKMLKLEADQRELTERMEKQDQHDKELNEKAQQQLRELDNDYGKSD